MTSLRATVSKFMPTREEGVARGVALVPCEDASAHTLAPDEVLVEVKAAAVNYIDLLMLSGQYHHKPELPYTPGLEYAGVVRAVGSAVTTLRPGERVMNDFMTSGPRSHGAHQRWGGWAKYAVAAASSLLRVPDVISDESACNLLLNYETAIFGLEDRAQLVAGETVLVMGATGAAGLAAVQVAKLLGAGTVIATGRGMDRLEHARRLGADHAIDLLALPQPHERALQAEVKALTGRGADILFDPVGGDWLVPSMRALDFGGRHVIIGWAANTNVAKGEGAGGTVSPDRMPTNLIQMKGLVVMGSPMSIITQRRPQTRQRRLDLLARWMRDGSITPVVSRRFAMTQLQDAMQARLEGVIGGCVLTGMG
ncbi:zinc-binding dehydrogenase [Ramlibacter sp.]|uniref:zinc-binding dehydrogenase n=1 Tax=Ramlibacter sp. TaxID=1917967 RepID=UPI003D0FDC9A